jgi:hypothetical protein
VASLELRGLSYVASLELRAMSYELRPRTVSHKQRPAESGGKKAEGREAKCTLAIFVIPTPNAAEESATPQKLFSEFGRVHQS